jgi:hypothetical protein
MPLRSPLASLAAAVCLLVLPSGTALAETHSDAAHHFTLELPSGWKAMSPSEVEQINTTSRQLMGSKAPHYEGGFRRASDPLGTYPYILVQLTPGRTAGTSYDEIQKSLSQDFQGPVKEVEGKLSEVVQNVSLGSPTLDRTHNRVVMVLRMNVAAVGPIQGLTVGHIGSEGILFLHSYAPEKNFSRYLPTFNQINDSFQYDQGYTFTPGRGTNFLSGIWSGALIGAAVGGFIGLARVLMNRSRRAP